MAKKVSFNREATDKLIKGLNTAADAVAGTVGPKGRNVYITETYGNKITNDGVTVANKIVLADPEEDAGAYVIRNVTGQQNDDVGDGTTTTAILTQAIIKACMERPENPMEIRQALNESVKKVFEQLKAQSKPITKEDVERVALISAEDPKLASIISQVVKELGEKAVINVEDSKTMETTYEIVDGYEAQAGYISPYFVTDTKTAKATFFDVLVLVVEKRISNVVDIAPLWKQFEQAGIGQCVIVCEDIDDAILRVLIANKIQGKFQSLVIRASGDVLKDIEGATGARAVGTAASFQNIKLTDLGSATKVVADAHKTLFVSDHGMAYADQLEATVESEPNMYRKEKLKERIAQLRGGVAILKVAASTDFEREYLKLKAEDAIKAVSSALEEGIVEGGGMALWRIAQSMGDSLGEQILSKALRQPFRKIIENSGKDYAEVVAGLLPNMGWNAQNSTYSDLIADGIVDPAKVERKAVANAVSAAGTLITTFCLITDIPNDKN